MSTSSFISSVQFSCSVVSDSLRPHVLQHTRLPCPSPTPGVYSNSCPLSRWCHPTISSSVVPFSSCPQSFPGSRSFPMSQFFASGGQSVGVSALVSILPMNIQDWFPLVQARGHRASIPHIFRMFKAESWRILSAGEDEKQRMLLLWGAAAGGPNPYTHAGKRLDNVLYPTYIHNQQKCVHSFIRSHELNDLSNPKQ